MWFITAGIFITSEGKKYAATDEKILFWVLFGFYVVLNLKKQD